ncbi:MAG: formylmethanofuran dehydrogenase subunit A [Candidatus Nezhaarchaeota archaeon]|nr:formylmethanofuran dehydrogenase subunit A [Candidatus Nezhaarchaeota archaeon]MCX8141556.1 formylmethanofuran dehydrogenase subunit A [Candidatus Nezhaarchaeota archaeon]MDW8049823.1 formylmethanofuran dehydrogenase subunit A [Nitrososphaerota archaeon]
MRHEPIIIKGGYVIDPLNKIDCEVMDIGVANGKIVDPSTIEHKAKVIDAKGKTVMPGGIDIHSHVAGPKFNAGRIMMPPDHRRAWIRATLDRKSAVGLTVPSTTFIGFRYAQMGWTTVIEPATPPFKTRHTHEELDDIPILDKACFPLFANSRIVLDLISRGDFNKLKGYIAWLLNAVKGYAIKIVNPGVAEPTWWNKYIGLDLDDQIPEFGITPREIVRTLCRASLELKLPHQIHVHCNRLGFPGNYVSTLKTMDCVSDLYKGDRPIIHITHVQFTGYAGTSWANLASGGEEIANYLNAHNHVTLDLGQVIFGDAVTMTADAPFEYVLYHILMGKWHTTMTEAEATAGVVPYTYRRNNYVNTVQWCVGLDVALLTKDPWKIVFATDNPNAGRFTKYPTGLSWLVSRKAREEEMKRVNKRGLKYAALPSIDREYTLYDLAIVTRAAPARIVGLEKQKGHLGIGADADIAVYDLDPTRVDVSRDYKALIKALRRAYCTIKSGVVVVRDGVVVEPEFYGVTYYVDATKALDPDLYSETVKHLKSVFPQLYTVAYDNYIISDREIRRPLKVEVR